MNRIRVILSSWVVLTILVVGCATKKGSSTSDDSLLAVVPEEDQVPAYVPEPAPYRPSKTRLHDLIHTRLRVSFDWTKQYMNGVADLTLEPYFFAQDSLIIDAKGFDVKSVQLVGDDFFRDLAYKYDSAQLVIDLDRTYRRGEQYDIKIKYTSKPNELPEGGSAAISSDKGLYFINPTGEEDKPKQIWTQGETEASSCWFPTIDSPNEKCTQEIFITVDTTYTTLSNGVLVYSKDNGNGTRTDYWKQDKPHAPYLFMMTIGQFAKISDSWKDLEVDYYVEKEFEPYAKDIFGNTPEMMDFFSNVLGYPYPWDKYSQVVVRDYVSGAMENTSASVFMEQLQMTDRELLDKNWDYIIAHELFHHWFGDLVTCESWSNLALNESFANYSEYLWLEYKFGREEADYHWEEELEGYLRQARTSQYPIVRFNYAHRMDMFDAHAYNKGGIVLHMLRKYLGDEAFFASLKHYLKTNEYTDVEIHELRIAFEDVTGQDLNWFFDQWFLKPGHVDLDVRHSWSDNELSISVIQEQDTNYTPIYRLPVDVEIWVGDKVETRRVVISEANQTLKLKNVAEPDLVVFDAEQQILGNVRHHQSIAALISQYEKSDKYLLRHTAIEQLAEYYMLGNMFKARSEEKTFWNGDTVYASEIALKRDEIERTLVSAVDDKFYVIRSKALEYLTGYEGDLLDDLLPRVVKRAGDDGKAMVRSAAIDFLARADNQEQFSSVYKSALEDSAYSVVASGLLAYVNLEEENTSELVERFKASDKIDIFSSVAKYYTTSGDSTQYEWMKTKFMETSPSGRIKFVDVFANYIKVAQQTDQAKAIDLLQDMGMTHENMYTRYACFRGLFRLNDLEGVQEKRQKVIDSEDSIFLQGIYKKWESSLPK